MLEGSSQFFAIPRSQLLMLFATSTWRFANSQCTLQPGKSHFFAKSCRRKTTAFRCCGFDCRDAGRGCGSFCCWNAGSSSQPDTEGSSSQSDLTGGTEGLAPVSTCAQHAQHDGTKKSLGRYTGRYEAFEYVEGAYLITADQTHKNLESQAPQGDTYMCSAYATGGWGADRALCCGCGAADPLVATRQQMFAPGTGPKDVKYKCYYGCKRVDCGSVAATAKTTAAPPMLNAPTISMPDAPPTSTLNSQCSLKPGQDNFFASSCSSHTSAFHCCGFECKNVGHGCGSFCCWSSGSSGQAEKAHGPIGVIQIVGIIGIACGGCCVFICFSVCVCFFWNCKTKEKLIGDDDDEESDVELPDDAMCPSYWTNHDLSEDFDERYEQEDLVPIVQEMLDTTWKDIVTRDRKGGEAPDRLEVVSVQRFEDSTMWAAYLQQKEKIKARGPLKSVLELDGDFSKGHVLTDAFARYLTRGGQLDQNLNEHYLFHGTSPDAAENIAESGFRINLAGSNAGTMFGKGAYFAECSSKSDEYAVSGSGAGLKLGLHGFSQEDDEYAILLCRVVCGKMFRALRASEKSDFLPLVQQQEIDGVLGDREASVGTYREFVVFKEAQIYPEYRVLYHRVYDDEEPVE